MILARHLFLFLSSVLYVNVLLGQYDHEPVLSDLEGEDLIEALRAAFTPEDILSYGPARDTMYRNIYLVDDSVRCMYTGHSRYLAPNVDPTDFLFDNDNLNGINTEHVYPRSKGADDGNARSDMHHLFPTRALVNSSRGSDAFTEIPDNETLRWFYRDQVEESIPSNRDVYAEDDNSRFEPREDIKGNVARAMMYFFLIYNEEAMAADPDYFELQRETLCQWHYQDPVDQHEWERTYKIAFYQENKPNPFVLDCTLAGRSFCDSISSDCRIVHSTDFDKKEFHVFPNPSSGVFTVIPPDQSSYDYQIHDVLGKKHFALNRVSGPLNIEGIERGLYFLTIRKGKRLIHSVPIQIL